MLLDLIMEGVSYLMTAWNFLSSVSSWSGFTGFSKCTSMVASFESR